MAKYLSEAQSVGVSVPKLCSATIQSFFKKLFCFLTVREPYFTFVLSFFLKYLAASTAKYWAKGAVNKLAASAASPDYVKVQAEIKSAASAASLRGGRASGRLDQDVF